MSSGNDFSSIMQQYSQMVESATKNMHAWNTALWGGVGAASAENPQTDLLSEWTNNHAKLWQAILSQPHTASDEALATQLGPVTDRRFAGEAWENSPIHDYLRRSYLLNSDYLRKLAETVPVEDDKAKQRLRFAVGQVIDACAPNNYTATNPEVIQTAIETGGESIRQGILNLVSDLEKGRISMTDESAFEVGVNLATTEGAVVYQNPIFQLIQYKPLTEKVNETPLLIVPPCINKYYILDLQAKNSFVRYAVEQGNTVFLISWCNAKESQGNMTWDDYVRDGVLQAISLTQEITAQKQINVLGFCVGGTLLSSALAVAKAKRANPVKSLTLLTTLLDFTDSGEIGCFVDEKMVSSRESTIGQGGIMTGASLASGFSSLRPNDLIWNYVVGNYLKGNQPQAFDLLYWNSDPANLPGPFFAWYLRNMYHENNLMVPNKLEVCGTKVDLGKINVPTFILGSREDHIVPWQSAYASRALLGGKTKFVLGASGHIAGVINPANSGKRSYWVNDGDVVTADEWMAASTEIKGSWWPEWSEWLAGFSNKQVPAPASFGNVKYDVIEAAPGSYVKEKA